MVRSLVLCFFLLLVSGCRDGANNLEPSGEAESLVMNTYALPAESADVIMRAINGLLSQQLVSKRPLGGAHLVGSSSLVVLAPERLQPSVERTIDALVLAAKTSDSQPKEDPIKKLYTVQFWIIQEAGPTDSGHSLPEAIAASEAAIRSQFGVGPLSLQNSMAVSLSDEASATVARRMSIKVELRKDFAKPVSEIALDVRDADFGVTAKIPLLLDTPIVLSQIGGKAEGDDVSKPRFVILLVRDAGAIK